jgi:hypothetical protein
VADKRSIDSARNKLRQTHAGLFKSCISLLAAVMYAYLVRKAERILAAGRIMHPRWVQILSGGGERRQEVTG